MRNPLLTSSGSFDRSAIMRRAWSMARKDAAYGRRTLRECFASALRYVWDEARGARSYAVWATEQDQANEAAKALDIRTRQISDLEAARAAAIGIDSSRAYFAAVQAIECRLAELRA